MKNIIIISVILFSVWNEAYPQGWFWQNPYPHGNNLYHIHFANNSTGYAVGDGNVLTKTTDAGNTWTIKQLQSQYGFSSAFFVNNYCGYASYTDGKIFKTTNGGEDWIEKNTGLTDYLKTVFFINENIGWAAGNSSFITKTTDGGNTWVSQTTGTSSYLNEIYFEKDGTVRVEPLKIKEEMMMELQNNLVLFYLNINRSASAILSEQNEKSKKND